MKHVHEILILLVEDNESDVFFLQHAFKKAGIQNPVHIANDGQEAIDYLAGQGKYADRSQYPLPCLIILDLQMPRRTGLEVLQWLRAQPDLRSLPVIVHTASSQQRDVDAAYQLGANAFVVKPASITDAVEFATLIKGFWLRFNEPPSRCVHQENEKHGSANFESAILIR